MGGAHETHGDERIVWLVERADGSGDQSGHSSGWRAVSAAVDTGHGRRREPGERALGSGLIRRRVERSRERIGCSSWKQNDYFQKNINIQVALLKRIGYDHEMDKLKQLVEECMDQLESEFPGDHFDEQEAFEIVMEMIQDQVNNYSFADYKK